MMTADVAHGRQSTIGTLIPTWEARLIDTDTGKDVPYGTQKPGELWVRGPSVMKGYYKNPDATAGTFSTDGWFKTGDSAFVNPEGYFQIADRLKELIKYKGFQGTSPLPPSLTPRVLRQLAETQWRQRSWKLSC